MKVFNIKKFNSKYFFAIGIIVSILLTLAYFQIPKIIHLNYSIPVDSIKNQEFTVVLAEELIQKELKPIVAHKETPEAVKAIYISSWAAGTKDFRKRILNKIEGTEINSVVIDIKDYSGRISFNVSDSYLKEIGSVENRIPDIIDFINELHNKEIYVIGRISVFQDPYLTKHKPDLAVKKLSDKNTLWTDYKGIGWLDAGAEEVWKYIVAISKESYSIGFDELNFDYIRFPSDRNMKDIYYPFSENKIKAEVIRDFFSYLHENLKESNITTSANLFGMTITNTNDLNIGQILEFATPYFDFIAPMIYPSHFPNGWNGYAVPAKEPYNVIKISIEKGIERLKIINENPQKIRVWLQDFNLGAKYTPDMVTAQIQAVNDAGLDSWMLWDPSNTYTHEALIFKPVIKIE